MTSSREPLQPMPRKVIALVAAGIAAFTVALVVVLWWWGTAGLSGKELVTARLDALRTALSIGLGGGGLFALYLAWRRQHATEVGLVQKERDQADVMRAYELQREVAATTEKDAADRRVTELYTKASEQLGSDKAPVRLAGIYALERLAQDNPQQRQTIVNLLCAYLRMPYEPPGDKADSDHRERVQEREVRHTAQQVLESHLRSDAGAAFWGEGMDLNLRGATLLEVDFRDCHFGKADFVRAVFRGESLFDRAAFAEVASFDNAEFRGGAVFDRATFTTASFTAVSFGSYAGFIRATVKGDGDSSYSAAASFVHAVFDGSGNFSGASFDAGVDLSFASGGSLDFSGAFLGNVTRFRETKNRVLGVRTDFAGVSIAARVSTGSTIFPSVWPEHWVIGDDGVVRHRPVETSESD